MKKLFSLFFALVASAGILFAASGTCGENLTWDLTDGVLTISGTGEMTKWHYNIDVPWYSYRESITSVTIGNSVTSIGFAAFWDCTGLTSITIPNSVTSIGDYAFSDCSNLESIVVNENNQVYDSRDNCNAIIETSTNKLIAGCKNTNIPASITTIGFSAFEGCTGLTSITIPNSVTSIEEDGFYGCTGLTSVSIPNSVTSIGDEAFRGCSGLTTVTIGNSVTSIGDKAFFSCSSIKTITCYSQRPPTINDRALHSLDYSTIVYVPADYLNTYVMHDVWGLYDVRPLGATSTETTDLTVVPNETTATVTWPAVSGAATYELVIKDKNGNVICTLIFNANGQLTSIAFAPARDKAPQQTQSAGFAFTVTGLDGGTAYDLTIDAKDNNGSTLSTKTVSFITNNPQGIEMTNDQLQITNKVIRDGQIFILRGDKTYTLTGQEVK